MSKPTRTPLQQLNDHHFDLIVNQERIEWLHILIERISAIVRGLPESTGKHEAHFYELIKLSDMAGFMADGNITDLSLDIKNLEQEIKALEGKQ